MNPLEDRRKYHCRKVIQHLRQAITHAQKAEERELFFPDTLKWAIGDLSDLKKKVATVLSEGTSGSTGRPDQTCSPKDTRTITRGDAQ